MLALLERQPEGRELWLANGHCVCCVYLKSHGSGQKSREEASERQVQAVRQTATRDCQFSIGLRGKMAGGGASWARDVRTPSRLRTNIALQMGGCNPGDWELSLRLRPSGGWICDSCEDLKLWRLEFATVAKI